MTTFMLPMSQDAADEVLAELGALATATEWKRAAIVNALVLPHGERKDSDCTSAIQRVTANQFSKRGIHGLTSPHSVQRYRDAWQDAVDAGLTQTATLGAEVELPDVPWGPRKIKQGNESCADDHEPDEGELLNAMFAARKRAEAALAELRTAIRDVATRTGFLFVAPAEWHYLAAVLASSPDRLLPTPVAVDGSRAGVKPDVRGRWAQLIDVATTLVGDPPESRCDADTSAHDENAVRGGELAAV